MSAYEVTTLFDVDHNNLLACDFTNKRQNVTRVRLAIWTNIKPEEVGSNSKESKALRWENHGKRLSLMSMLEAMLE